MNNPIIVALDVASADEARALVRSIGNAVGFYKVGLELYAAAGIAFVDELLGAGHQVFLDLKLHDIPETVKRATAQVAQRGVQLLTVHGLSAVMRAAMEGRGDSALKLLGVTVLTSVDQIDLAEDGYACTLDDLVRRRVDKARQVGIDGVVCSPLEARWVREAMGPERILVVPGVRSAGVDKGDQKRVATPAEAMRVGATYLVIGRQITRAADPRGEALRILDEVRGS